MQTTRRIVFFDGVIYFGILLLFCIYDVASNVIMLHQTDSDSAKSILTYHLVTDCTFLLFGGAYFVFELFAMITYHINIESSVPITTIVITYIINIPAYIMSMNLYHLFWNLSIFGQIHIIVGILFCTFPLVLLFGGFIMLLGCAIGIRAGDDESNY
jgi:hypothetical protein